MPKLERSGGFVINYEDLGDPEAPAVVLLHTAASDLRMWAPHIGPFSENYRVIAPDLRGHGETTAPQFDTLNAPDDAPGAPGGAQPYTIEAFADDLGALLDSLDIPLCALVGSGFGGMVALQFATTSPGRVAGLVLSETSASLNNAAYSDAYRTHEAQCQAATELVARLGPAELGKRAAAAIADPFLAAGMRARYAHLNRDGFLGAAHASRARPDLLPVLEQRLTMPVLICFGAEDPARSASEVMAAHVPRARVVTFQDTAHGVPVLRPEAFGKAVFAFFREIEDAHGA